MPTMEITQKEFIKALNYLTDNKYNINTILKIQVDNIGISLIDNATNITIFWTYHNREVK